MGGRRQVAFKEDVERLEQAAKEDRGARERGDAEAAAALKKLSADFSSAVRKLDQAVEGLLRNQDKVAAFLELDADALPELRHRLEVLEGALGGAKSLAANVRRFGLQGGVAVTAGQVLLGAAIGSEAGRLRDEAATRRLDRDDATVRVLRDVDAKLDKVRREEAAFTRAQRGLR